MRPCGIEIPPGGSCGGFRPVGEGVQTDGTEHSGDAVGSAVRERLMALSEDVEQLRELCRKVESALSPDPDSNLTLTLLLTLPSLIMSSESWI